MCRFDVAIYYHLVTFMREKLPELMNQQSSSSNRTGIIIVIVVVIAASLVAGWYWGIYKPAQEAKEQARLEQLAKEEADRKRREAAAQRKARYDQLIADADAEFDQENWETAQSLYSEASSLFPNQQYPKDRLAQINTKLDEIAALEARKAAGIVEQVTSRTERFYVIVSSSIDDDLAMDYASKLAKEGNIVKIIEHDTDTLVYYRVSVADYDTRDQAVTASSSFSSYGNGDRVWVFM